MKTQRRIVVLHTVKAPGNVNICFIGEFKKKWQRESTVESNGILKRQPKETFSNRRMSWVDSTLAGAALQQVTQFLNRYKRYRMTYWNQNHRSPSSRVALVNWGAESRSRTHTWEEVYSWDAGEEHRRKSQRTFSSEKSYCLFLRIGKTIFQLLMLVWHKAVIWVIKLASLIFF